MLEFGVGHNTNIASIFAILLLTVIFFRSPPPHFVGPSPPSVLRKEGAAVSLPVYHYFWVNAETVDFSGRSVFIEFDYCYINEAARDAR